MTFKAQMVADLGTEWYVPTVDEKHVVVHIYATRDLAEEVARMFNRTDIVECNGVLSLATKCDLGTECPRIDPADVKALREYFEYRLKVAGDSIMDTMVTTSKLREMYAIAKRVEEICGKAGRLE